MGVTSLKTERTRFLLFNINIIFQKPCILMSSGTCQVDIYTDYKGQMNNAIMDVQCYP